MATGTVTTLSEVSIDLEHIHSNTRSDRPRAEVTSAKQLVHRAGTEGLRASAGPYDPYIYEI